MDLLSIITGIGMVSFLLFYLAFNLDREHWVLKIMTVAMGVLILLFIPQAAIEGDKDCTILNDGSYKCFYSNGTAVTNFEGGSTVGSNFVKAYSNYLIFFGVYLFLFFVYLVFTRFREMGKEKGHGL